MAASQVKRVGGYRCEFIDPVSDDFICKVCNCVAREPNLTVCCGQHYCQSCITKIVEPCPNPECGEATFNTVLDKNYHRKILALRVHCTMKDRGCQWTGKVEQLDDHLDVNSGDCQYVDIECPEKCGQQVQKHQLAAHIANECPKRDFTCMHCGFKATYEVVSEQHWPECQNYPVPCPNRCQIGAVERNTLEDHLKMCSMQVVDCDFSYAGCNEKLRRQHMEKHIEENTQKHLALMAAASMKMSQELQEQRDEFRGYLEQKERETAEQLKQKDEQIKAVEKRLQQSVREKDEKIESMRKSLQKEQKEGEQQLQQQLEQKERQIKHVQESLQQLQEKDNKVQGELHEKQQQIDALKEQIIQVKQDHEERIKAVEQRREEQIKSLEVQSQQQVERIGKLEKQLKDKEQELEQLNMKLGMPPFHFAMSNFNQLKTSDANWNSPPMYTHPHGYKFNITVYPNGVYAGRGTHVTVYIYSIPGEFDATLQWPAKFTITLQLLNQHRDQDHITVTEQFQWSKPKIGTQRTVDYFSRTVIAHTDLELNAQKQTQYLKDDCLCFCINKIEVSK